MSLRKFKFLFAFRNVTSNKKSSLVVILTLSLVFTLLIILLGINGSFKSLFELDANNEFNNLDIVISYDEYSEARLINKRNLEEDYDKYFDDVIPFFNFNVLTESSNQKYYSQMLSSLPYEFELIIEENVDVNKNNVIITKSYAKKYNLEIGDSFTFHILDEKFDYSVGEILEDKGIFNGISFYVNKEEILVKVFGLTTLNNFGNTVYIDVSNEYKIDDVIDILKLDDNYNTYQIEPTVDWEYINSKAMQMSSMLFGVGVIVLFAILMVVNSLFPIINRNFNEQLGVVKSLGGTNKLMFHITILQWLIYTFISFVIGILMSNFVMNFSTLVYGIKGYIPIQLAPIGFSLIIILFLVLLKTYIIYKKELKESTASLSYNRHFAIYKPNFIYLIISMVILILELIFNWFTLEIHSLIVTVLSVYISMHLLSLLLILIVSILKKYKNKSVFNIFQIKYLIKNKHIHQSLRVVFISLLSVVLLFSIRGFLNKEIENLYDLMTFDIEVINITDYSDELKTNMSAPEITSIDEAIMYNDITVQYNGSDFQIYRFFVSMDYSKFGNYYNLDILEFDERYLDNEVVYVVLPRNAKLIYDLQIGDTVVLNLNYKQDKVTAVVAGYLDTNLDNFVFSNLCETSQNGDFNEYNSMFINTNDLEKTYSNLIKEYSKNMYYIMDPNLYFEENIEDAENVLNFFYAFTAFMIVCFVIVIFNNTLLIFYDIKNDLARVKVLGAGNKTFINILLKELIIVFFVVLLIGSVEIYILSNNLKYVVLLTTYYKDVSSTTMSIIYGFSITIIVLIISYLYYLYKISKIKIIDEIKIY